MSYSKEKSRSFKRKSLINTLAIDDYLCNSGTLDITLIDDDIFFLKRFQIEMEEDDYSHVSLSAFHDEQAAISHIKRNNTDIIIIDFHLKDTTGVEIVKVLKKINMFKIPIILISSDEAKLRITRGKYYKVRKPVDYRRLFRVIDIAQQETL